MTRTDRLGDVCLALPALALLSESVSDAEIFFSCRDEYSELLKPFLSSINVRYLSPNESKSKTFDAGLFLYPTFWALTAATRKIGVRVGPLTHPHCFLLLTDFLKQERSSAEKNEAQYNVDLAHLLLKRIGHPASKTPTVLLPSDNESMQKAAETLRL